MRQLKLPATFMRGGTSNAIVFRQEDLPEDRELWSEIFIAAIGSPDPYARQLNGMGGGISSLSKVCVVGPSTRPDADLDYTFAQVAVREASVEYTGNCGNMSAAMAPFAVDEGYVKVDGDKAVVRIHNTNTSKIIEAHFDMDDGLAAVDGVYELPGVGGMGSALRLDFLEPGGAITGEMLPTGNTIDELETPSLGKIEASIVDASALCVLVEAGTVGLTGDELPKDLEANPEALRLLQEVRGAAAVKLCLIGSFQEAMERATNRPSVGFVSRAMAATTLTGEGLAESDGDVTARMISMGDPHRALPGTCSTCLAVASQIDGTLVHRNTKPNADGDVRLMHPSGVLHAAAKVRRDGNDGWFAENASLYRTQRRLFDGNVYVSAAAVPKYRAYLESVAEAAE
ncbi:MAG: 2-methylaconitate cis-trans isomerase PrpF family protein [Alphaproteobacteria bacterium]